MTSQSNNKDTINLQQLKVNYKNYLQYLFSEIKDWQTDKRMSLSDPTFNATVYLADKCGVTQGTFLKWFTDFEKNGCKLGSLDNAIIINEMGKGEIHDIFNKLMRV